MNSELATDDKRISFHLATVEQNLGNEVLITKLIQTFPFVKLNNCSLLSGVSMRFVILLQ